jgi:hypothetical protein
MNLPEPTRNKALVEGDLIGECDFGLKVLSYWLFGVDWFNQ